MNKLIIFLSLLLSFSISQDYSLEFDGQDDFVNIGNAPIFNSTNITIQFDLMIKSSPGGASFVKKADCNTQPCESFNVMIEPGTNRPYFVIFTPSNSYCFAPDGFTFKLNQWYNMAVTNGSSGMKMYINGLLVSSSVQANMYSSDSNVLFGSNLNGQLDNILIYNEQLSGGEILYNIENDLFLTDGIIGLWDFNTGSGTTLYDQSGNDIHGIINGATWIENIYGCTDPVATNYNADANLDDGNCEYPDNGNFSLSFDGIGSSVIDVSHVMVPETPTLTFSLDFKLDEIVGDSNNHDTIFDFENSDFRYTLNVYNDKLVYISESHNINLSYNQDVVDGNWHNVVVQLNQNNATLIIDNDDVVYQSWDNPITYRLSGDTYDDFIGGNQPPDYPYMIRGNIDNFIISKELLSFYQVKDIESYNAEVYYKFNEGLGDLIYDFSGNKNHAIFYSYGNWQQHEILVVGCNDSLAENYNPDAYFGDNSCIYPDNGEYSLSFDGNDDSVNGSAISLDVSQLNLLTLSAWVKPNRDDALGRVFSYYPTGSAAQVYAITIDHGKIYFLAGDGATSAQEFEQEGQFNISNSQLNLNEWNHIAITYDNEAIRLYLNGNLNFEHYVDASFDSVSNGEFFVGSHSVYNSHTQSFQVFDGEIDDIIIFDIAYDNMEIKELFNNSSIMHDNNLLAHYKFNASEGNILYDHSGNGNHGSINGATWVENIYGCTDDLAENYSLDANWDDGSCEYPDNGDYSLSFDGVDDYAVLDIQSDYNYDSSISFWFKSGYTTDNPGNWIYLLGKFEDIGFSLFSDGKVRIAINVESGGWGVFDSSPGFNDNEWHYVTATRNSYTGEFLLYIDSQLVAGEYQGYDFSELTGKIRTSNWGTDFRIGLSWVGHQGFFDGFIDNVSVWDEVLSQNEIENNFQTSLDNNFSNSIASYRLNSGTGDILYDHSGNSNHGTIHGATWITNGTKHVDTSENGGSDETGNGSIESPFGSIQYAIDMASDGDTILVSAGTYFENINFNGKNIALIGEDRETTIIDGGQEESVLKVVNGEQNTFISELTLQNGYAHSIISGSELIMVAVYLFYLEVLLIFKTVLLRIVLLHMEEEFQLLIVQVELG